jgi:2-oxoisovalerate dehydrogenase E1 component
MSPFADRSELYQVLGALFQRVADEPPVARALVADGLVLRFHYTEPEGQITVDLRGPELRWELGPSELRPTLEMFQSAEVAHRFWLGELNVPLALASRKVVARGDVAKALALLPALRPVFPLYRALCAELGRGVGDEPASPGARARRSLTRLGERARDAASRLLRAREPLAPVLRELPVSLSLGRDEPRPRLREPFVPDAEPALGEAMLRCMHLVRAFEEKLAELNARGELPTEAIHLSIGQEAVAVGACFALRPDDYMATTHRGHGHMLAKGAPVDGMMAEILGRASGLCAGKGGSMHVTDARVGALGANGIVGASPLLAAGAAHAIRRRGGAEVAVAFFGDGATNQGMFHEALNFAAVLELPAVFVLENNGYGEFTSVAGHTRAPSLAARAISYGMPAVTCDGNDVYAVHAAVAHAVARARAGGGPTLVVCDTYRWHGHMEGDPADYRPDGELELWKARCPLRRLHEARGELAYDTLRAEACALVEQSVRRARESGPPPAESMATHVFAPDPPELWEPRVTPVGGREISCSAALREALRQEMERDPRVYLLGEDVTRGGYFAVTSGLVEALGRERIVDTPISEYAIVGSAVGAALAGARPVAEILFADFLTCGMDPLVNNAAKLRYMSGGQVQVPLVVRTPGGPGLGMAAQHSQSFESLLAAIPGLIIVAPYTPADAKGLLTAAIRSNNPVLFFENKLLYAAIGAVPEGEHVVPLGVARVAREGRDVTIVAVGGALLEAEEAARELAREGIEAEIIDPRTITPLDFASIAKSVRKTGRLVTVEDAPLAHGLGAEVVARTVESSFGALRAAPRRLGGAAVPIAYAASLEALSTPDVRAVVEAVRAVVRA